MGKRLLLHICCGPCASHVISVLGKSFHVSGCFYNPNIHPEEEYLRRLASAEKVASLAAVDLVPVSYDPEAWHDATKGWEDDAEGGERCGICFRLRLKRVAELARGRGYDLFCTTLTVSPHKHSVLINRIGKEIAAGVGVGFHEADFKEGGGFEESCRLSRGMKLYRQTYCGCVYSARSAGSRGKHQGLRSKS